MIEFRLNDMDNLITELFINFNPNDILHEIDVYKSLGCEIGSTLNYLNNEVKHRLNEKGKEKIELLDSCAREFLKTLVPVINFMAKELEIPENWLKASKEYAQNDLKPIINKTKIFFKK